MISKPVNKHQMAFIKGRQIIDAALIASEEDVLNQIASLETIRSREH